MDIAHSIIVVCCLQRHYAVLQALALDEDDMPEINDETLPDEEGMARPGVVKAVEEFKLYVYGENYDEESDMGNGKASDASEKRKTAAENATKESANYNWPDLADNWQVEGLDSNTAEVLLDSAQSSRYREEGSFDKQDINSLGKVRKVRLIQQLLFFQHPVVVLQ
ncbi:hypothetical protein Peur_023745 [Populus x canadensis]